jgi:hypothetical protein
MEHIKLYPKIHIYKNVFKDVNAFLEKALKETTWEGWYTFGEMLPLQEMKLSFDHFPTKEEYISARGWETSEQAGLTEELGNIFYDVTKDWLDCYPDEHLPNYVKGSASVNKYKWEKDAGVSENYSMNYHSDYVIADAEKPGDKFGITTTFYLNDNYENGEICFRIDDHFLSYKPEAGDVIVFPSSNPYQHAVRKATGAERFMIRSFWQYHYPGSDSWHENVEKFGQETWEAMDFERFKNEVWAHQTSAEDLHEFFGKDNGIKI